MKNSNRVREVRKKLKLSGPEVASRVGISTQYLYDLEKGERRLGGETLAKLSDVLKATTDYLLCTSDVNLYGVGSNEIAKNPDPHEESELAEIPIERLNRYKLVYQGHELSKEEADDVIKLLEAALKRWKK